MPSAWLIHHVAGGQTFYAGKVSLGFVGGGESMNHSDSLPDEDQRRRLCELLHAAFIELRCVHHRPEQVHDLAYAFHNLPLTMYGWGSWSISELRTALAGYRERHPQGGPDYAAMLDAIFPDAH